MSGPKYYEVLGVNPGVDFAEIRKAYRRRAMDCHPDRFGGDPAKAEEFKLLVEAFNVLSDPLGRRNHDMSLGVDQDPGTPPAFETGYYPEDRGAILDTLADDILEELVVGNTVPENTSLQTLMLDLEQTERFCLYREAKTRLYAGSTLVAEKLFRSYIRLAPVNILAHYFLARCLKVNGNYAEAERELRTSIRIGQTRQPPLRVPRIRHELNVIAKKRPGLLGALRRLFGSPPQWTENLTPPEIERATLNRELNRLAATRMRRRRPLRGHLTSAN